MQARSILFLSAGIWACQGLGPDQDPASFGSPPPTGGVSAGACGQSPAPALFEHALCLCGDLDDVGNLQVHPGARGEPSSIGINGRSRSVSFTRVSGDWYAHQGLDSVADLSIGGDLITSGSVDFVGRLSVDGDLRVAGDLIGTGALSVEGGLYVGGRDRTIGHQTGGTSPASAPPAGAPCGCDPSTFLDVSAMVDAAAIDNDNLSRGIDDASIQHVGSAQLRLPTGRYFFQDVETIGHLKLSIEGAVAIFIDGRLDTIGDHQIEIGPNGSLDLYVKGGVGSVGRVVLGDPDRPSAFRLYLGGEEPVQLGVGQSLIYGAIYAPEAQIAWVGQTKIEGALFAHSLDGVGQIDLGYASAVEVEVPPGECPPPPEKPQDPGQPDPERPNPPQGPNL